MLHALTGCRYRRRIALQTASVGAPENGTGRLAGSGGAGPDDRPSRRARTSMRRECSRWASMRLVGALSEMSVLRSRPGPAAVVRLGLAIELLQCRLVVLDVTLVV